MQKKVQRFISSYLTFRRARELPWSSESRAMAIGLSTLCFVVWWSVRGGGFVWILSDSVAYFRFGEWIRIVYCPFAYSLQIC